MKRYPFTDIPARRKALSLLYEVRHTLKIFGYKKFKQYILGKFCPPIYNINFDHCGLNDGQTIYYLNFEVDENRLREDLPNLTDSLGQALTKRYNKWGLSRINVRRADKRPLDFRKSRVPVNLKVEMDLYFNESKDKS